MLKALSIAGPKLTTQTDDTLSSHLLDLCTPPLYRFPANRNVLSLGFSSELQSSDSPWRVKRGGDAVVVAGGWWLGGGG
ncbi:hypothetical protein Poly59_46300 [Rubripirellula reticaptiva]|uniref:Uncharacterized protein n=1 Tax=Rubripirellula reticaptiva TaxID=2528013 RepID=A0A5C6EG46_9BACT|nr:hypothetical protein Poly59_46300 [Rubripirellula reticaptiva]